MEILRIKVILTGNIVTRGGADTAVMLPFTGECDSPLFQGKILPGGVDTQRIDQQGRTALSARYTLEGTDDQGKSCRLFIENTALAAPGEEMVTRPVIRTDSESLRWLETADLSGRIEHFSDHIEIVISAENRPHARHIAIKRAGLTLRGVLEKKTDGPCPLVLMLHGYGGCMDDCPGGWFQEWSDALTAAGFATLRFDFNGHGCSDGEFSAMTPWNEVEDAAAFLRCACALPEVTEISLLGHSQGGVIAGMLAGLYPDRVKKLVMLTPAASLKDDAREGTCMGVRYDAAHIPDEVQIGCRRVGGLYFRMAQCLPIHETAARFTGPALAVLGGRDSVIRPESIRRYGEMMPDCRVAELPGIDHGLTGEAHGELVEMVAAFLGA